MAKNRSGINVHLHVLLKLSIFEDRDMCPSPRSNFVGLLVTDARLFSLCFSNLALGTLLLLNLSKLIFHRFQLALQSLDIIDSHFHGTRFAIALLRRAACGH